MKPSAEPGVWLAIGLLAALLVLAAGVLWGDWKRRGQRLVVYAGMRMLRVFCNFWYGVRPPGRDPLPAHGPVVLISNHTSPADPLVLQSACMRLISFMMAREYFTLKCFQPIFQLNQIIPVNRTGHDIAALKGALRAINEGRVIGIFPEGGINLNPRKVDEGRPGATLIALRMRVPVVPAFIARARHTNRLWEGLLRRDNTRVIFGDPIDFSQYYGRERDRATLAEAAKHMMAAIEQLRPRRSITRRAQGSGAAGPQTPSR